LRWGLVIWRILRVVILVGKFFRSFFEKTGEGFNCDDHGRCFSVFGFAGSGIGDAFTMVVWLDE